MSGQRTPPVHTWTSGVATDTGLVRDRNEDRYWVDDERGVFLVVDGVGGHAAGELAAETAVEEIRQSLFDGECGAEERARRAITRANNRIFEPAQFRWISNALISTTIVPCLTPTV